MRRGFVALATAIMLLAGSAPVHADKIDDRIVELESGDSYKIRVAAAVALSKKPDDRAAVALTKALQRQKDATVRRVAAVALAKVVTTKTRSNVRDAALDALKVASKKDKNKKVRKAAAKTLKTLGALFASNTPRTFVYIAPVRDRSKQAPGAAIKELEAVVRSELRGVSGISLDWPGSLPTGRELERLGTRAFIVLPFVTRLEVDGGEVACSVEVRVSPWAGADGDEKWVEGQSAKATSNGQVSGGSSASAVNASITDCVAAVGEQVMHKRATPFLKSIL